MGNAEGPFEYYNEIHAGVDGNSIRAAAKAPGTNAAAVQALAGELEGDEKKVAGQIEGDIEAGTKGNPKAAAGHAHDLAVKGTFAVALLNQFAGYVDTFDKEVDRLNTEWKTRVDSRYSAIVHNPKHKDSDKVDKGAIGAEVKRELQGEYDKALTKLDDDADDIAAKFKKGPTAANVKELIRAGCMPLSAASLYGVKLTDKDKSQYYKNFMATLSPADQKKWIEANKTHLDPLAAPYIDPAVQAEYGKRIADAIKADGKMSDDDVKLMAWLSRQHPFAHALFSEVTPAQISDEIKDWDHDVYPGGKVASLNDDDKEDAYKAFLTAAGTTFATYTKGSGIYEPPSNLDKTWLKAITDDGDDGQGARLSLLLRAGGHATSFDDHFISNVAGGALEWEKKHQDDHPWGSNDEDQGNGTIDPFRTGDDYGYATDGMSNLLASMEHSPKGAQDFFLGRYDGATGSAHDRMEYLVHDRTFKDEDRSDDGDGLGKALQGAIVGEDTRTVDGTTIANDLFKTIADHSGEDSGGDTWFGGWGGANNTWHVWNGMTDSLGMIASGYSGDIYDNLDNNPGAHAGDPLHLQLDTNQMKTILGEIGHSDDKTGIETLTTAMVMEGNHRTGDFLDQWKAEHPGVKNPTLDDLKGDLADMMGVGQHNGDVMRKLLDSSVTIDQDEEEAAETRQKYLAKAFDLAGGFVPGGGTVLGEGASELSKMTYDTVKGEGLELLKNAAASSPDATSEDYTKLQSGALPDKMQYGMISQLYQHGFIHDAPAAMFAGNPPEVRPDLYDAKDGASKIDPKIGGDEKQVLAAWSKWQSSHDRLTADGLTVQVKNSFFNGAGLPS